MARIDSDSSKEEERLVDESAGVYPAEGTMDARAPIGIASISRTFDAKLKVNKI